MLEQVVHGPRNEALNGTSSQSTALSGEEQTASLVRELFTRARDARRDLLQQWRRNFIALNNRGYRPGNQPWDEEPAVSSIWPVTASATSWLTDQRPIVQVTPTAEAFSDYWDFYNNLAQDMNVVMTAIFHNYGLDAEINKAWWDVYTYGIGYFKTQWDATLADGLGDGCFRRVDPWTVYPDPYAKSPADLSYIIEAKRMTIADADRAWPGAAKKLQSVFLEDTDYAPDKLDGRLSRDQPRAALGPLAPSTSVQSHVRAHGVPKLTDSPLVTILECYVRGYKASEPKDGVAKVQDDWRCIIVSGNVVLMDEKCSDINAFGTHPYDRLVLFDTGEWYGPCTVEFLIPIQRMINWILGAINRNLYLMGNPVIVEDARGPSRNNKLTNRPGQRFPGIPGKSVGWLNPPQPHPQMSVQLVQYYESKVETISGLSAMIRGFAPTGRNAQGVLDSVQDAAFVRVRASLRELRRTLNGVTNKLAANIAEFYTEPRLMSIIGPDGQQTHLSLRNRHFYALDAEDRGKRIPLRFSLMADVGSEMPTSKQARAAEAKHLFELQAIDVYELLKAMDWPNYALVAQRQMEQMALRAMAQQGRK